MSQFQPIRKVISEAFESLPVSVWGGIVADLSQAELKKDKAEHMSAISFSVSEQVVYLQNSCLLWTICFNDLAFLNKQVVSYTTRWQHNLASELIRNAILSTSQISFR